MYIDTEVKNMSVEELYILRTKITMQLASGEVSCEDFMRADIEITRLIAEKTTGSGGAL